MEPGDAPENSGENSGDLIRRDIAHHGTGFVMDGQRVDPALVTPHEGYWRVYAYGTLGETHLTTLADEHTLCGHHRRPDGGWHQVFGPIDAQTARADVTVCLTCRSQIRSAA